MNIFWDELTSGLPNAEELARALIRLTAAAALGAIVGLQRQKAGKPAGLRTHMLVCLGTTVFVLASTGSGMSMDSVSRRHLDDGRRWCGGRRWKSGARYVEHTRDTQRACTRRPAGAWGREEPHHPRE